MVSYVKMVTMSGKTPLKFFETLVLISKLLAGRKFAFRGTTSLILQGIDMVADDIDILCDKGTALASNYLLREYLVEEVSYKKSPKFKSFFGKFKVNETKVEIYGEWQIKDTKGNWSNPFIAINRHNITYKGKEFYVTDIEDELLVYALMGRWNAFHKIKRQLKAKETSTQTSLF